MAIDVKLDISKPNVMAEISLNNENDIVINLKYITNSYDKLRTWNKLEKMDYMSIENVSRLIKDLEYIVSLAKEKEGKMVELKDDGWLK